MGLILPDNDYINKFIEKIDVARNYSKITIKHIKNFIIAATSKGFSGKTTEIESYSMNHRTTISHFLSKGKWNEKVLDLQIKKEVMNHVNNKAIQESRPLFISVDDTVNCKKKPSSQAEKPIEETGFHYSHLLGKKVWGHQVLAVMASCGDCALSYDIHRYEKGKQSKIDYIVEMANAIPVAMSESYALFDSWFTCPKIIHAFESRGYYCIGALKTNRIIYPAGIRISVNKFAEYIEHSDVDLVTVNSQEYYVYRYEGSLNGIENSVVLLSWPKDSFKNPKALKAFICTNPQLETEEILKYYTNRWCIEVFFKQEKVNLGFNKYQIRSIKGIERLWLLMSLVHLFCITGLDFPMSFGTGLRFIRDSVSVDRIRFIYNSALNKIPIHELLVLFHFNV